MFSERMRPAEGPTVPWCWQGVMGRAVRYNTNLKAWVLPQKLLALWSRQLLNLGFVFSKTGSCSRWDPGAGPAHPSSALLEAGTSPQLRLCPTWEVTAPFRPPHTAPAMTDCHRKGWIPGPGRGGQLCSLDRVWIPHCYHMDQATAGTTSLGPPPSAPSCFTPSLNNSRVPASLGSASGGPSLKDSFPSRSVSFTGLPLFETS